MAKKRRLLKIEWPAEDIWVLDALEKMVSRKKKFDLESSVGQEVSRIVKNYLTGVCLGRKMDSEIIGSFIYDEENPDSLPDAR
jgi:hypothetical protein